MVVHVFPAAKLTGILLRQISRPIANSVKDYAKTHPYFRKYLCMPPAYMYNWCEVKVKMWSFRTGKPIKIPPLNDAMAIELGASILGELVIFVTAAIVVTLEYIRQKSKEEKKEQLRLEELENLHSKIQNLKTMVTQQEEQIIDLYKTVRKLEKRSPLRMRSYFRVSDAHDVSDIPQREYYGPDSGSSSNSPENFPENESSDNEATSPSSENHNINNSQTTLRMSTTDSGVVLPESSENYSVSFTYSNAEEKSNRGVVSDALTYVMNGVFFRDYKVFPEFNKENDAKIS